MASLIDILADPTEGAPQDIQELRLGQEPAMVLVFTPEVEEALLHWEQDEAVRSFIVCPGEGCPLCYLAAVPQKFHLLPVYDLESREVRVLRVSDRRGPGTLGATLLPHLKNQDASDKLLMLSRNGPRYAVEAHPIAEGADRGEPIIKSFLEGHSKGLKLSGAFLRLSPDDIAEIERVRRKLEARGGWEPLRAASPEDNSDGTE